MLRMMLKLLLLLLLLLQQWPALADAAHALPAAAAAADTAADADAWHACVVAILNTDIEKLTTILKADLTNSFVDNTTLSSLE